MLTPWILLNMFGDVNSHICVRNCTSEWQACTFNSYKGKQNGKKYSQLMHSRGPEAMCNMETK